MCTYCLVDACLRAEMDRLRGADAPGKHNEGRGALHCVLVLGCLRTLW